MRNSFQPIGPAEYDAAVERSPEACLLYAMGDHRTGQQVWPHPAPPYLFLSTWEREARALLTCDYIVLFLPPANLMEP